MNYRNKKLLEACRELPCQHCGRQDGTVCAAHSNHQRHGKGTGIKAHDCFVAALCHSCHTAIDSGKELSRDDRADLWKRAHDNTMLEFFRRGIIEVK